MGIVIPAIVSVPVALITVGCIYYLTNRSVRFMRSISNNDTKFILMCVLFMVLILGLNVTVFGVKTGKASCTQSMRPNIDCNDLLLSADQKNAEVGDVVEYYNSMYVSSEFYQESDSILLAKGMATHRIIGFEDNRKTAVIKGDNNNFVEYIPMENIFKETYIVFHLPPSPETETFSVTITDLDINGLFIGLILIYSLTLFSLIYDFMSLEIKFHGLSSSLQRKQKE